jgi:hypothetical protein
MKRILSCLVLFLSIAFNSAYAGNGVHSVPCTIVVDVPLIGNVSIPCSQTIEEPGDPGGDCDTWPSSCGAILTYDCSSSWTLLPIPE